MREDVYDEKYENRDVQIMGPEEMSDVGIEV